MKKLVTLTTIAVGVLLTSAAGIYFTQFDRESLSQGRISLPQKSWSQDPSNPRSPASQEIPKTLAQPPSDTLTTPDPADLGIQYLNEAFARLAEELSPSVVNIYTTIKTNGPQSRTYRGLDEREFYEWFFPYGNDTPQESQSLGSGFIIDAKNGLIVTNSHVVSMNGNDADEVLIKFIDQQEQEGVPAEILGTDPSTDVALLRLKNPQKQDLIAARLGRSGDMRVGEWVLAIGNPYGHAHTVTQGIISALGRNLEEINRSAFIQTSASINPGNSGGPLFNLKGEVIGINTAIDPRAQGIGFAIPIDAAAHVIDQLIAHGEVRRGWIGVAIADLPKPLANQLGLENGLGVLVQSTQPGQPASRAGIREHDIIVGVNQRKVASPRELANAIADVQPGQEAEIQLYRNGRPMEVSVKVGKRPESPMARRPAGER